MLILEAGRGLHDGGAARFGSRDGSIHVQNSQPDGFDAVSMKDTVPRDLVVGRAELRYWPLGEAGLVDRYRAEGVPSVGLSEVPRSP